MRNPSQICNCNGCGYIEPCTFDGVGGYYCSDCRNADAADNPNSHNAWRSQDADVRDRD